MLRRCIVNTTRNQIIAAEAEDAHSPWTRLRGLLGRQELGEGQGIVLRPASSIHTFFMAFAIDVIFADREGMVLHTIPRMGPWRVSPWVRGAYTVIEVPAGTVARTGTQVGDRLSFGPVQERALGLIRQGEGKD